jgi:predicted RNase H-like HicB family nuclease
MSDLCIEVVAERCQGWWALTYPSFPHFFSQGQDENEVEFMTKDLFHHALNIPRENILLSISYIPERISAQ